MSLKQKIIIKNRLKKFYVQNDICEDICYCYYIDRVINIVPVTFY